MRILAAIGLCVATVCGAQAIDPPIPKYHLTARPTVIEPLPRVELLDAVDSLCRFAVKHQDARGAFIDPVLGHEHQYATPYLAYAIGTLVHEGRRDLLGNGVRAMDYATACLAEGREGIPDDHGEFFLTPLTGALALYKGSVNDEQWLTWQTRLQTPLHEIIEGTQSKTNNWRTYAMRGESLRASAGLVDTAKAVAFLEDAWNQRTQRERIGLDRWNMYQDWNGHPQSLAVEAVGRVNLLAMIHEKEFDFTSRGAIVDAVERGTRATLLFQDPTGQCPPNGRTDNHVFNDVLYGLCFDIMAARSDDAYEASQYRRAADLAYRSIERWKIDDGAHAGSYSITKNFFPPEERVGYQPASQVSNYSGALMVHLAEAYHLRGQDIAPLPAPTEIGGYAIEADPRFGAYVANAGGMLVQINLLGDSVPKYGEYWTPLGGVRFARAGWDSRLGPSDGVRDGAMEHGLTFAPAWKKGRRWVRLSDEAEHYRGTTYTEFVHPLLVRFTVLYSPVTGVGGPSFHHHFTVTPDGVFTSLTSPHDVEFALTIPLLENDGRPLHAVVTDDRATTRYAADLDDGSEQHFIATNGGEFTVDGDSIRSAYGWLRPVRLTSNQESINLFIYPRSPGQPDVQRVQDSFVSTETGFRSDLGRVERDLYVGRTAVGGVGRSVDTNGDGVDDIVWDAPCGFIAQVDAGRVTAIECDRDMQGTIAGRVMTLQAYTPVHIPTP